MLLIACAAKALRNKILTSLKRYCAILAIGQSTFCCVTPHVKRMDQRINDLEYRVNELETDFTMHEESPHP